LPGDCYFDSRSAIPTLTALTLGSGGRASALREVDRLVESGHCFVVEGARGPRVDPCVRLTLHPDKTHVGDCQIIGQGFKVLGYRFEARPRLVKSMLRLRDKIRANTRRTSGQSLARVLVSDVLIAWVGRIWEPSSFGI
jgi:hypothetical protein